MHDSLTRSIRTARERAKRRNIVRASTKVKLTAAASVIAMVALAGWSAPTEWSGFSVSA
jgi:hypothetical protein